MPLPSFALLAPLLTASGSGALQQPSAGLAGLVHLIPRGGSSAHAATYPDLRSALEAAGNGDLLVLDPGLYTGPENKELVVTKDVEIRGRLGSPGTVIDCEGAGRVFDVQGARVLVEGLTLRRGQADLGGAIRLDSASEVTVKDGVFESNTAISGGAMHCGGGSRLSLSDCLFVENSATFGGGALSMVSAGELARCTFERNRTAAFGGAIFLSNDLAALHAVACVFRGNAAASAGGAICELFHFGPVTLDRCTIADNQAGNGAGLFLNATYATLTVRSCVIRGNVATNGTGGIFGTPLVLSSSTVVENRGATRGAGGVHSGSLNTESVILNSIVRDNTSNATTVLRQQIQRFESLFGPGMLSVRYSDVQGISSTPTAFDLHPQFLDPAHGDYHIAPSSPCRDAGLTDPELLLQTDLDGEPRVQGPAVDVGADEVATTGVPIGAGVALGPGSTAGPAR